MEPRSARPLDLQVDSMWPYVTAAVVARVVVQVVADSRGCDRSWRRQVRRNVLASVRLSTECRATTKKHGSQCSYVVD